jgi:GTP-binding protein
MALSGASGAGVPAVLDKLLEIIGPEKRAAGNTDDGEESTDWSPV